MITTFVYMMGHDITENGFLIIKETLKSQLVLHMNFMI